MKQIPFAKNYFITESGEVYRDNVKLNTFIIKDTPHTSIMYDTGVKRTNSIGYLLLSTYKPLDSNLNSNQYRVKYIDGNKNNISLGNLTWISRSEDIRSRVDNNLESINKQFIRPTEFELKDAYCTTKIECEYLPGYYWLPHFDLPIVINEYGNLKYLHTGEDIPWQDTGYGYKQVGIKLNGKYKYYYVHRLVCTLFNPISDLNITNKQVNHKDGIKSNNYYTNLEWVTPKENVNHAINTGLVKFRKVHSKNILTGEIKIFNNVESCAKHYDITFTSLRRRLSNKNSQKYTKNWCIFKYEDDEWLDSILLNKVENSWDYNNVWICISKITNVISIHSNLQDLCIDYNIDFSKVSNRWKYYKKDNMIDFENLIIKFSDTIPQDLIHLKDRLKKLNIRQNIKISVRDLINNQTQTFDSIKKTCRYIKFNEKRLSKLLKLNNQVNIDNKFVITYLSNDK